MMQVWLSAAGLCGATVLGSLLGFFIKELPHKWNDSVLGYCAGIMLAAATVGLIVPAFDMVQGTAVWLPALGVLLGAWLLNVLDLVTPHMHTITGLDAEEHKHNEHLNRIMLFVLAIAIHKLPEGMAAGVSMNGDEATQWTVSLGIALQNVPEGMGASPRCWWPASRGCAPSCCRWPSVCSKLWAYGWASRSAV